ncbi:MAG: CrcB family protein [Pseudomonadota bacterium]
MNPWLASALVALGGALGALMRFWLAVLVVGYLGRHLPFATFITNVAGSAAIGVSSVLFGGNQVMTAFVISGVLGGFTTFSTFSIETVRLFEQGRMAEAMGYAGLSVVACVAGAAAGVLAARAAT